MHRTPFALIAALALAACQPANAPPSPETKMRADLKSAIPVKVCADGTLVGRMPSGDLLWQRSGFLTDTAGYVAEGITPDQFCK